MTDRTTDPKLDELLSAFLDGEATAAETHDLLDRMGRDPRLQAVLDRHHRLRASLRGESNPALDEGFLARVMAGIEDAEIQAPKVLAFTRKPRMPMMMRATLGMAMAASLAAVTVLSVQALLPSSEGAFPLSATDMSAIERPTDEGSVRVATGPSADRQGDGIMTMDELAELNHYLISHNNSSIDHGLTGTMGFMRVAADDGLDLYEDGR